MSRDVVALLDHLHIAKADYFGYSMGAFMGAYLLGHHADRFNAMILGGIGDATEESAKVCHAIAAALRAPDPTKITDPLGAAYRAYAQSNPDNDLEALALSALQMWPEEYPGKLGGDGGSVCSRRRTLLCVKFPVFRENTGNLRLLRGNIF